MTLNTLETALKQLPLLKNLPLESIAQLKKCAQQISFLPGDIILREGDASDAAWILLEGDVQIFKQRADGRHIILNKLRACTLFGEQGVLNGHPRSASARAHTAVVVLRIPGPDFQAALAPEQMLRQQLSLLGEAQRRSDLVRESALFQSALQFEEGHGKPGKIVRERALTDGEILFREGEAAHHVFVILSGRAAVYQHSASGPVLLRRMSEGQTIGELALLHRKPRAATVIADGPLRLYEIDAAYFFELQQSSPDLQKHLQTLDRAYLLPQRGFVSQYAGRFLDHEALNTIYDLEDGRRLIASNAVGKDLCNLERIRIPSEATLALRTVRFTDSARGVDRELRLSPSGDIYGITAQGEWPELSELYRLALDGQCLASERVEAFARSGSIGAAPKPAAAADLDERIICGCVNIRRAELHRAIAAGANTLPVLQQETRCGTVCGGCLPSVRELLGGPGWSPVQVHEELPICEGIRTFRLKPLGTEVAPSLPGQHIVLQAEIDGCWVQRPYTLSAASGGGYYEITMKREPQGLFSRWMFDHRRPDSPLRISQPQGDYYWEPGASDVVCLVAGIGLTPALAICRTILENKLESRLYIDYSARRSWEFAYATELAAAAQARPNIEVKLRETSRDGRLDAAGVAELSARFPDATYFLCGPDVYLNGVAALLAAAGVPKERIRIEVFSHIGDAPVAPAPKRIADSPKRSPRRKELDLAQMFPEPPPPPKESPLPRVIPWLAGLGERYNFELHLGKRRLNPLSSLVDAVESRLAGIDPRLPSEHLALFKMATMGALTHQLSTFAELERSLGPNRARAQKAQQCGAPLPSHTPDGDTFTYMFQALTLAQFDGIPIEYRVDTGWRRTASMTGTAVYVTRSPTALRNLLCDAQNVDRGPIPYHYWQQFVGYPGRSAASDCKPGGLFAGQYRNNKSWRADRDLAQKQAGQPVLEERGQSMAEVLSRICEEEIDVFIDRYPSRVIDASSMMMQIALRIVMYTTFPGVDEDELDRLGNSFVKTVQSAIILISEFVGNNVKLKPQFEKEIMRVRGAVADITKAVREVHSKGGFTPEQLASAMVHYVLHGHNGQPPADTELTPLLTAFLVAGHETTGNTMAWALYELGRNPQLYKTIQAECDTFFAENQGRPITVHQYEDRPYMLALLFELGRRHPPFPQLCRSPAKAGTVPPDRETGIGAFDYPKDTLFILSVFGIHMNKEIYPHPEEFRIERFLEGMTLEMSVRERGRRVRENAARLESQFRLLTFGAGDGMCVGRGFNMIEFFLVLDAILHRYDVELVNREREVAMTQNGAISGPTPGGIGVRLKRRSSSYKATS